MENGRYNTRRAMDTRTSEINQSIQGEGKIITLREQWIHGPQQSIEQLINPGSMEDITLEVQEIHGPHQSID